jgi:hypothetical protein
MASRLFLLTVTVAFLSLGTSPGPERPAARECGAAPRMSTVIMRGTGVPPVPGPQLVVVKGVATVIGGRTDRPALFLRPGDTGNRVWSGGPFEFTYPLAAVGPTGDLHVVWGEPDPEQASPPRYDGSPGRVSRLYYARRHQGVWTTPQQIYRSSYVRWHPLAVSRLLVDPAGNLHLALTSYQEGKGWALVYLTRGGSSWRAYEKLFERGDPAYADLAVGNAGEPVLAYVAPSVTSGQEDSNSLFVVRMSAGRWEDPVLVSLSGRKAVTDPELVKTTDGRLHLMVGKNLSGGVVPDVVWVFSSTDGGRRWTGPSTLKVQGSPHNLRAIAGSSGEIHLALQADLGETIRLLLFHWVGGKWQGPADAAPGMNGLEPDLTRDASGQIHLLSYQARDITGRDPNWVMVHSILAACR